MGGSVTEDIFEKAMNKLTKKLDVMIYLLLDGRRKDGVSARDMVKELMDLNLKDTEIASILGKSRSYISKEMSQIRKYRRRKKNAGN